MQPLVGMLIVCASFVIFITQSVTQFTPYDETFRTFLVTVALGLAYQDNLQCTTTRA